MPHISNETKNMSENGFNWNKFSVAVIGDSGVGKTSLITRYIFTKFSSDYHSTIEDFYSIKIKLPSDKQ